MKKIQDHYQEQFGITLTPAQLKVIEAMAIPGTVAVLGRGGGRNTAMLAAREWLLAGLKDVPDSDEELAYILDEFGKYLAGEKEPDGTDYNADYPTTINRIKELYK